jgi:hypothetical protein
MNFMHWLWTPSVLHRSVLAVVVAVACVLPRSELLSPELHCASIERTNKALIVSIECDTPKVTSSRDDVQSDIWYAP